MSIGPARNGIELAVRYALDRKQFSRPIADFGLIQKKFAMMATLFFAAESMIYRTGALIDDAFAKHAGTIEGNRKAAEEYSVECSMCKVFATDVEAAIIDEALQVFGGYGFTEEFPIARHYRDARVSRIYEGTNEINRLFIADRLARRIKEGRITGSPAKDSFISELAAAALDIAPTDQIGIGAVSDLLIMAYAEQSVRLRAKQVGGHAELLRDCFMPWANARAAEAYQVVTGKAVTLPAGPVPDWSGIAHLVYEKLGPL
jgi:hypothetical protein